VIGVFGYFMRRRMDETPEFTALSPQHQMPLLQLLRTHLRPSLISFAFGSFNGALTYTLFGFLNIYLSRYLQMPLVEAMQLNLLGLLAFMIGSPCMGHLFDRLGQKRFLIGATLAIFSLAVPIFLLFASKFVWVGQILLGLCVASIAGTGHAVMQGLFPVGERYRGIALNFSMGMGLFGGITPIIYIQMIERSGTSLLFPAFFLMGLTALFGTAIAAMGLIRQRSSLAALYMDTGNYFSSMYSTGSSIRNSHKDLKEIKP